MFNMFAPARGQAELIKEGEPQEVLEEESRKTFCGGGGGGGGFGCPLVQPAPHSQSKASCRAFAMCSKHGARVVCNRRGDCDCHAAR